MSEERKNQKDKNGPQSRDKRRLQDDDDEKPLDLSTKSSPTKKSKNEKECQEYDRKCHKQGKGLVEATSSESQTIVKGRESGLAQQSSGTGTSIYRPLSPNLVTLIRQQHSNSSKVYDDVTMETAQTLLQLKCSASPPQLIPLSGNETSILDQPSTSIREWPERLCNHLADANNHQTSVEGGNQHPPTSELNFVSNHPEQQQVTMPRQQSVIMSPISLNRSSGSTNLPIHQPMEVFNQQPRTRTNSRPTSDVQPTTVSYQQPSTSRDFWRPVPLDEFSEIRNPQPSVSSEASSDPNIPTSPNFRDKTQQKFLETARTLLSLSTSPPKVLQSPKKKSVKRPYNDSQRSTPTSSRPPSQRSTPSSSRLHSQQSNPFGSRLQSLLSSPSARTSQKSLMVQPLNISTPLQSVASSNDIDNARRAQMTRRSTSSGTTHQPIEQLNEFVSRIMGNSRRQISLRSSTSRKHSNTMPINEPRSQSCSAIRPQITRSRFDTSLRMPVSYVGRDQVQYSSRGSHSTIMLNESAARTQMGQLSSTQVPQSRIESTPMLRTPPYYSTRWRPQAPRFLTESRAIPYYARCPPSSTIIRRPQNQLSLSDSQQRSIPYLVYPQRMSASTSVLRPQTIRLMNGTPQQSSTQLIQSSTTWTPRPSYLLPTGSVPMNIQPPPAHLTQVAQPVTAPIPGYWPQAFRQYNSDTFLFNRPISPRQSSYSMSPPTPPEVRRVHSFDNPVLVQISEDPEDPNNWDVDINKILEILQNVNFDFSDDEE